MFCLIKIRSSLGSCFPICETYSALPDPFYPLFLPQEEVDLIYHINGLLASRLPCWYGQWGWKDMEGGLGVRDRQERNKAMEGHKDVIWGKGRLGKKYKKVQ